MSNLITMEISLLLKKHLDTDKATGTYSSPWLFASLGFLDFVHIRLFIISQPIKYLIVILILTRNQRIPHFLIAKILIIWQHHKRLFFWRFFWFALISPCELQTILIFITIHNVVDLPIITYNLIRSHMFFLWNRHLPIR